MVGTNAVKKLSEQRQKAQKNLETVKKFLDYFNGEFWTLIVESLYVRLKNHEAGRVNFQGMSDTDLKVVLAREDEVKEFINMPDRMKANYKMLVERLSEIQKTVRDKTGKV